ncbi:NAC domain-containing protein 76-like [Cornus florida]|uniref:NAC domain-containing protein 76-like n=1 Tax=Cornus florida TaxID=4283 RepID=UPI00289D3014|nr:NAC domain-containing protein 76-like [Cornus florida]
MSDDKEEKRCPLCAEEIDGTDQLKPCQCGYQKMEEWRRMVPPGVRFSPTPAELLNEYLRPRVNNQSVPKGVIRELNVYQFNPMELKAFAIDNGDNQNMYFFTNLQRKTKDGVQIRRGTNDGCWRASNKYLNIFLETVLIGFRKDLTYTWKSGGHGRWLMKEPELQNNKDTSAPVQPPQVESGFGECATSIDTRPLQIRDSDAIIERDLQYSAEKDHDREDLRGNLAIEIGRKTSALNSCLKNVSEGDGTLPLPPEVPSQYHANSKGTQVYAGRDFGFPHGERYEIWLDETVGIS